MLFQLIQSLAVVLALIAAALWLRRRGVLTEAGGQTLSRITTDLILPALVFASLSRQALPLEHLMPAIIMLTTTLSMLAVAWLIGRRLGLPSPQLGAFVLVAGFGSSSTLGYSLIGQVYTGNTEAAFDAVLVSELGAVLPLFLVGVPIAMHFGQHGSSGASQRHELAAFTRSPIFIALVAGLAASFIGIPDSTVTQTIYRGLDVVGAALPVFVTLGIGSMLCPVPLHTIGIPVALVLVLKLLVEPLLAVELAELSHMSNLERNVLLIEAAMPSGMLAAIVAARYGCDGAFASLVVVVSCFASLISVPVVASLVV